MSHTAFRILGPLEIERGQGLVALGGRQQRALLALLLLHANQPMSADRLVDELWGEPTPERAVKRLQVAVTRLRRTLDAQCVDMKPALLQTVAGGYRLMLRPGELDAAVFEERFDDGRRALEDNQNGRAADLLREALALWRGPALADLAFEPFAQSEIRRLDELRFSAVEARVEAELQLGQHSALVGELEALVAAHPTRERLAAKLMLALYRCNRQTEALETYARTRRMLVGEIGVEPGPELSALQTQILAQSPALELQRPAPPSAHDARDAAGAGSRPSVRFALPRSLQVALHHRWVGREVELENLHDNWRQVDGGERLAVILDGEPGIGKTRLAAELAHVVHAEGALVLYGRCDDGLAVPYQPFVEALRPYAMSVGAERLRGQLGGLSVVLARLWPELWPADELVLADPESERLMLFEAVGALLEGVSSEHPVLLILDDLHWAPSPTLMMLRHVIRSERRLRVLVFATYRGGEVAAGQPLADLLADMHREPCAERMRIGGIDESATVALVEAEMGGLVDERAQELARVLYKQTAGNPFFIRELIAHLEESRAIRSAAGPHRSSASELDLPEGLRELIARRVSRLSEAARTSLNVAAVVGPRFSLPLLERALAEGHSTLDALDEAVAAGLLSDLGQAEYAFAHVLVRQALYRGLGSARRIRIHRRIGEALEADTSAVAVEELAHHFAEAVADGQADKAARYAVAAARSATQRLGYEEAALHCERGLHALAQTATRDDVQQAELLIALGEARWGIGDVEAAQRVCQEASQLAEGLDDSFLLARAALGFAGPLWLAANDEVAQPSIDLLERALAATTEEDDTSALSAHLMARLSAGLVPGAADDRRAVLATRAVRIARSLGDPPTLAYVLEMKHWVGRTPDKLDEQLSIASELTDLARSRGDRRTELQARIWVLDHYLELGDVDGVRRELATLQRLGKDAMDRRSRSILLSTLARHAHLAGDLDVFEALAQEGFSQTVEGRDESGTQIFGGQMVALRREQHRLGEVIGELERFVAQFPGVAVWPATLAYVYAELEQRTAAQHQLDILAQNNFMDLPRDGFWMSSMAMLSEVAAFLGDVDRAHDLYECLRPFADRCVVIAGVLCQGAASRSLGLLATTMAQYDEAEAHLAAALELNSRLGAALWVAHTRFNQASLLFRQGHAPDHQQALVAANDVVEDVIATAAQMGLAALAFRARRLRAQILKWSAETHRCIPATPSAAARAAIT